MRAVQAGIAALVHSRLALLAGIKMVLAAGAMGKLAAFGLADAFGGSLVGFYFRHSGLVKLLLRGR
jgi:hypothetical protein